MSARTYAMLTQQQIAEKYHVERYEVSLAISQAGIEPEGTVKGKKKLLKTYHEGMVADALYQYFKAREDNHNRQALKWRMKANAVEAIAEGRN